MGLLSRFDINSDFTQFFLGGLILFMTLTLLLTWVAPKNRRRRGPTGKVDDRYTSIEGELID